MASIAASNFFSTDDISANEWKTFGKPRLEITKLNKQQNQTVSESKSVENETTLLSRNVLLRKRLQDIWLN